MERSLQVASENELTLGPTHSDQRKLTFELTGVPGVSLLNSAEDEPEFAEKLRVQGSNEPSKEEAIAKQEDSSRLVALLYDERMCAHAELDGKQHYESPERITAIYTRLLEEGLVNRCSQVHARAATHKEILDVHSSEYLKNMELFQSLDVTQKKKFLKRMNFQSVYLNDQSFKCALLAAGSVVELATRVAEGEFRSGAAIVRPPGHHAEPDKAMGFCLLNSVAVAAQQLIQMKPAHKVLIVDWDIHHGNGTQRMFWESSQVLYFSVHRHDFGGFFPSGDEGAWCRVGGGRGRGFNINVPWPHGGFGDADYLAVWEHVLLPVAHDFSPTLILISAGFDAADKDPLGECHVTPQGYAHLTHQLLELPGSRVVMALEGGYNLDAISASYSACIKELLGDPLPSLPAPPWPQKPSRVAMEVIRQVRMELSEFWAMLGSEVDAEVEPDTDTSNNGLLLRGHDPLLAVGCRVEVKQPDGDTGLAGSRYTAKVIERTARTASVVYDELESEGGALLVERGIDITALRPIPPPVQGDGDAGVRVHEKGDKVEACYEGGWWEGKVVRFLPGRNIYKVYFKHSDTVEEYAPHQLRSLQRWCKNSCRWEDISRPRWKRAERRAQDKVTRSLSVATSSSGQLRSVGTSKEEEEEGNDDDGDDDDGDRRQQTKQQQQHQQHRESSRGREVDANMDRCQSRMEDACCACQGGPEAEPLESDGGDIIIMSGKGEAGCGQQQQREQRETQAVVQQQGSRGSNVTSPGRGGGGGQERASKGGAVALDEDDDDDVSDEEDHAKVSGSIGNERSSSGRCQQQQEEEEEDGEKKRKRKKISEVDDDDDDDVAAAAGRRRCEGSLKEELGREEVVVAAAAAAAAAERHSRGLAMEMEMEVTRRTSPTVVIALRQEGLTGGGGAGGPHPLMEKRQPVNKEEGEEEEEGKAAAVSASASASASPLVVLEKHATSVPKVAEVVNLVAVPSSPGGVASLVEEEVTMYSAENGSRDRARCAGGLLSAHTHHPRSTFLYHRGACPSATTESSLHSRTDGGSKPSREASPVLKSKSDRNDNNDASGGTGSTRSKKRRKANG